MNRSEATEVLKKEILPSLPRIKCGGNKYGGIFYRSIIYPIVNRRLYRGKLRFVVGYSWVHPYSHFVSGIVHDCILGYGDNFAEAVTMAFSKEEKRNV